MLHAHSKYFNTKVNETDRKKREFKNHYRIFQFPRISFVQPTALDTFQRVRIVIMLSVKCQPTNDYLDEIVIFFKNAKEHFQRSKKVLKSLRDRAVTLNLKKAPSLPSG